MIEILTLFTLLWIMSTAEEYFYYRPHNMTSSLSHIAAYRSALTLDWLRAEDKRQRELAMAFETVASPPMKILSTDCVEYPRPSSGKVGRLILELLKNLEGDDGTLINEFMQGLVRAKILVETAELEEEPDFEALVKTPGMMMAEPHATFPRILAMIWLTINDPALTKKYGWCTISKVNKYVLRAKPSTIAKHMRALEPIIARARFIMEEFTTTVTPVLNVYSSNRGWTGRFSKAGYNRSTTKMILATPTEMTRFGLQSDEMMVQRLSVNKPELPQYFKEHVIMKNDYPNLEHLEPIKHVYTSQATQNTFTHLIFGYFMFLLY